MLHNLIITGRGPRIGFKISLWPVRAIWCPHLNDIMMFTSGDRLLCEQFKNLVTFSHHRRFAWGPKPLFTRRAHLVN